MTAPLTTERRTTLDDQETPSGEASQLLVPVDQQTIYFYGQPLVVVRLADGRVGAVLRWFCLNLQLDSDAQLRRIRRTEEIADDLVDVRIQTEGGAQAMATLILHAVPFWLAGIDSRRVREEVRPEIRRYKREVVDVLYAWAQTPRVSPTAVIPSEPVVEPVRPAEKASLEDWREYHLQMAALIQWRMDVDQWRGTVETRLEGLEAVTDLIPEILERLGPQCSSTSSACMRRRTRRTRRSTRISSSPLAWPAIRTSRTRTGSRWHDGSRCRLSEPSESHNRNRRTLTRSCVGGFGYPFS